MKRIETNYVLGIVGAFIIGLLYTFMARLTVIHDQLDSDILTYIIKAKAPFAATIPEMLNGTVSASMTPPAILFTVPYMLFKPATAFSISYIVIAEIAFCGMYLCVYRILKSAWISLVIGILFASLPFYPVYGLSVMGQPLVVYSFYCLWSEWNNRRAIPYLLIVIFALSSSLVLVGYADLLILCVIGVYGLIRHRNVKLFFIGVGVLLLLYIITNLNLLSSIAGIGSFLSHKTEYVITASNESAYVVADKMFNEGHYHSASLHHEIIFIAEGSILAVLIFANRFDEKDKKRILQMMSLFVLSLLIAGFYAFWRCNKIVNFRNQMGGILIEFQIDRFYWLYPVIWYLLLAYSLYFMWNLMRTGNWLKVIPIISVIWINFSFVWNGSILKINWEFIKSGKHLSQYDSVEGFFQEDLFDAIEVYILNQSGKKINEYKVISVGLYPSIALYNGFYCLDGYSNNYDVRYKHDFRKIISEEINKDESIRKYYDNWGNRVYAFASEIPRLYYISKEEKREINSLSYDFGQLKKMGCDYIFSSVSINNCDKIKLLDIFDTETSYYRVFLYEVTE